MADWLSHPKYVRIRDALVRRFVQPTFQSSTLRQVIFLCGARDSLPRENLARFLRTRARGKLVFYAEDVWTSIAESTSLSALEIETRLARLADAVLVIVESPGTFAELGTFSHSEELRQKLLLILDSRYERADSFVNTGPVKLVDDHSRLGTAIYTDLRKILEAAPEIVHRLDGMRRDPITTIRRERLDPKHILFFLSDLIAVIGPVSLSHCEFFVKTLGTPRRELDLASLLALGTVLKILREFHVDDVPLYYRPLQNGNLVALQHGRMFDLAAERARFLSVLQTIPDARAALTAMKASL